MNNHCNIRISGIMSTELENKRIQKECAELRRQVEEATTMIQEVTQTLERERSIKDALTVNIFTSC